MKYKQAKIGDKNEFLNIKEDKVCWYVLYILLLIKHLPMDIISDDALCIETIGKLNLNELIETVVGRYYFIGKPFTDGVAIILYQVPFLLWKILNPLFFIAIAYIIVDLMNKNKEALAPIACGMILLYPISYLESAGYIMTSTNYIYPIVALLLVVRPVIYQIQMRKTKWYMWFIGVLAIPFACNQDQYALVLLGMLAYICGYTIYCKYDKRIMLTAFIILFICIITYAWLFFSPGHIKRMTSDAEMMYWLPQYADWSFIKKIYKGYTTTFACLILTSSPLYIFLILQIAYLTILKQRNKWMLLPLIIQIIIATIGKNHLVEYYEYSCDMPDFSIMQSVNGIIAMILTIVSIISVLGSLFCIIDNIQKKIMVLALMVLGLASRLIMGLSATIYASSFRTFTPLLFILIIVNLLLSADIIEHKKEVKLLVLAIIAIYFFMW